MDESVQTELLWQGSSMPESCLLGTNVSPARMAPCQPTSPLAPPFSSEEEDTEEEGVFLSQHSFPIESTLGSLEPITGLTSRPGRASYGCHRLCHSPFRGPTGTPGGIQETVSQTPEPIQGEA